jgi:hypothetical protein
MRITLKTMGGQMPGVGRSRAIEVPEGERGRVETLVDAAGAAPARGAGRVPDAMTYVVTVTRDGGGTTELRQRDGEMSGEFARLLEWIESHG